MPTGHKSKGWLCLLVQRERDAATIVRQDNTIARQDDTIGSLCKALDQLPAQVRQSIASLQPNVAAGLGSRTGQFVNFRTDPAQQSAAAQAQPAANDSQATMLSEGSTAQAYAAAATQPNQAQLATDGPCDIPTPPIPKGFNSLEGLWQQYTLGTASTPSIRQLYADHGRDWQKKELGYNKVEFGKKRKLICAIEAVQQLELASPETAVSILKRKLAAHGGQLVRFTESLPSLDARIHPNGKHVITAGAATSPTALSSPQKKDYQDYLNSVKEKLKLRSEPVV